MPLPYLFHSFAKNHQNLHPLPLTEFCKQKFSNLFVNKLGHLLGYDMISYHIITNTMLRYDMIRVSYAYDTGKVVFNLTGQMKSNLTQVC